MFPEGAIWQMPRPYRLSPTWRIISVMNAFISPPRKIPFYLRPGVWLAERIAGRELLPARLLAWYPKVAVSSGILEALIAHREPTLDERMLKMVAKRKRLLDYLKRIDPKRYDKLTGKLGLKAK